MKTRRVTRYMAECGRGFWNSTNCKNHEGRCKCWTNPKNKACKTCDYGDYEHGEPDVGFLGGWSCGHPEFNEHSGAPEGHDYISVKCIYWELLDIKELQE